MIDAWQALALALLQGLTEFLPISSSAHLLLPTLVLGWPDQGLAFDVAVHFGTLAAVVIYFRAELGRLFQGGVRALVTRSYNEASHEIVLLLVASVPAIGAGLLLNDTMDSLRTIPVLAGATIFFALVLAYADRRGKGNQQAIGTLRAALLVGLAQALALIPGTSRSGITISAALLLGLSREAAARFSFLLSIPIIAGAALLKTLELLAENDGPGWPLIALATVTAGVSAYVCIALFLRVIERLGMGPFVIYRIVLGLLLLVLWGAA